MKTEVGRPCQGGPNNKTPGSEFSAPVLRASNFGQGRCGICGMGTDAGQQVHESCAKRAADADVFASVPLGMGVVQPVKLSACDTVTDTELSDAEIWRALDIARDLVRAGVPVFAAAPDPNPESSTGFKLPPRWPTFTPDLTEIDRWQPGWALCAIGGHALDALDTDPRNGGDVGADELRRTGDWPMSYGRASTPSGGTHDLIAPLGVGKGTPIEGVDFQGGRADGTGRGFVFISPTVKASKVDGIARPYRWVSEPDLARLSIEGTKDTSGQGVARRLAEKRSKSEAPQVPRQASSPVYGPLSGPYSHDDERRFTDRQADDFCRPFMDALRSAPVGDINNRLNVAAKVVAHFIPVIWDEFEAQRLLLDALGTTAYDGVGWRAETTIDSAFRSSYGDWKAVRRPEGQGVGQAVELADSHGPAKAPRPINLPEEFWEARPALAHIRQAAHAQASSADVALYSVLARLSAMVSPQVEFRSGLGKGSLNLFVAMIADSGIGKSSSTSVHRDLIEPPPYLTGTGQFRDGISVGSGEGLAEAYHGMVDAPDMDAPDGSKKRAQKVKAQVRENVFVYVDEGQTLMKGAERSGATIMSTLRSAWAGQTLGQANASMETSRHLAAGSYSMGMLIGFQRSTALPLLDDVAGGTPQRFLWCAVADPSAPDEAPDNPGPLKIDLTWPGGLAGSANTAPIEIDASIKQELRIAKLKRLRGEVTGGNPHDSQEPLMRCKVASLLAVLDGRRNVTVEDWALARIVWDTSCAVRDDLLEYASAQARSVAEAKRAAHIGQEVATREALDGYENSKVARVSALVARMVHQGHPMTRGAINKAVAYRDRPQLEAALSEAVGMGWIAEDSGGYVPGSSRPV